MHTKKFGSYRVHYNSDVSGEIILQNDLDNKKINIAFQELNEIVYFLLKLKSDGDKYEERTNSI